MNTTAVKKVLAHLKRLKTTKRVARFNMYYWGEAFREGLAGVLQKPICGTQACLAGETVLAHRLGNIKKGLGILIKDGQERDIERLATSTLGLDNVQKYRLFYLQKHGQIAGWPIEFETAYLAAKTPKKRLQIAIDRVQHFIVTDGAE